MSSLLLRERSEKSARGDPHYGVAAPEAERLGRNLNSLPRASSASPSGRQGADLPFS